MKPVDGKATASQQMAVKRPQMGQKEKNQMNKKKARGAITRKLGIVTEGPLNRKACMAKVRTLREGIKAGKYRGQLLDKAREYAAWYKWKASHIKKAA